MSYVTASIGSMENTLGREREQMLYITYYKWLSNTRSFF